MNSAMHTRALRAFFKASPAAFLTKCDEASLTSSAESMSMYAGYDTEASGCRCWERHSGGKLT